MNRSTIFNRRFPRPLDKDVYPIYQRFVALQKELVELWKHEMVSGLVGERGYVDLRDLRGDVTSKGEFIIRVKPVMGDDTYDELKFLIDFFNAYKSITDTLLLKLDMALETQARPYEKHGASNTAMMDIWKLYNNYQVHKLVMTLKILVSSMNSNKLEPADVYRFTDVFGADQGNFVASMDSLVREYDLDGNLSAEFLEHKAHFYEYPDTEMVQAYWNYARKAEARSFELGKEINLSTTFVAGKELNQVLVETVDTLEAEKTE